MNKVITMFIGMFLFFGIWQAKAATASHKDSVITKSTTGVDSTKEVYLYDSHGNDILDVSYVWDIGYGTWVGDSKSEYAFDNTGNKVLEAYYYWDSYSATWIGDTKEVYAYDSKGNETLDAYYDSWDTTSATWIGSYKYVYGYNSNGVDTLDEYYNAWDTTKATWIGSYKDAYHYDKNDSTYAYYDWDCTTGSWVGTSESVYAYDNSGNETLYAYYDSWDTTNGGTWMGSYKDVYAYNSHGKDTLISSYYWDSNANTWNLDSKYLYRYTSKGRDSVKTVYSVNSSNVLVPSTQKTYTYNSSGNLTSSVTMDWDSTSQSWITDYLSQKTIYSYNSAGKDTLAVTYNWNGTTQSWVVASKKDTVYNSAGNITVEANYNWDSNTGTWIGSTETVNAYDSKGNKILNAYYDSWDTAQATWVGSYKYVDAYDSFGNDTLSASYTWDTNTGTWTGSYQTVKAYDKNDNETLYAYYNNWDTTNAIWIGSSKEIYAFDSYGNDTLTTYYLWDSITNNWVGSRKYMYAFNSAGNWTLWSNYLWNDTTAKWYGNWKETEVYNKNDQDSVFYDYAWNAVNDTWVMSYKYTTAYNTLGQDSLDMYYQWNATNSTWTPFSKFVDKADGSYLAYTWDNGTNAWVENPFEYFSSFNYSFSLSPNNVTLAGSAGSSASIAISSTLDWSAYSDASWLQISTSQGMNDTLVVTALANTSGRPRTTSVIFYKDGIYTNLGYLTVTQLVGNLNTLNVSTNAISLASKSSSSTVTVSSNVAWTVTSNQSWLSVSPASGNDTATFTLSATANSGAAKSASITVWAPGVSPQIITVTQSSATATNCASLSIAASQNNIACYGTNNASAKATVTGGTAPYHYSWSTLSSDSQLVNIPAGTYSLIVTDSLGCVTTKAFNITQPAPINVVPTIKSPGCGKATGSVTIAANGGTAPYNYYWNTGGSTASILKVSAGIYSITVTDATGCTQTESVTLSNTGSPVVSVDSIVSTQCNINKGSIQLSVSQGKAPYKYSWNDGDTTKNRHSIAPGNYTVSVSDASKCVVTTQITVPATAFNTPSISLVTVDSATAKNLIVWLRESTSVINYYIISRESTPGKYANLDTIPYSQTSVYLDQTAIPSKRSYRYKISAVDYCNNKLTTDTAYKTIHLQSTRDMQPNTFDLSWESYEGTAFFQYYYIYRLTTDNKVALIDSIPTDYNSISEYDTTNNLKGFIVSIALPSMIDPTKPLKADIGPFSQSLSNMAESQLTVVPVQHVDAISMYPNPAHESFTINTKEPAMVQVFTLSGTVVINTKIIGKETIVTNGLPAGLYLVKIVTAGGVVTKSLVV